MMSDAALKDLTSALGGSVLTPADQGYDTARRIFNAMIDRRPALIARCARAVDVVACVDFAQAHQLEVSIRGGGHNVAGSAACDGGLMIDLSNMRGLAVDPLRRTARAEPGLTLGEFDRQTQVFGLATTTGIVSDTGIAGLTLGGGIGWLNGKHGLACDNVLSVEIVTADGRLRVASPAENPDLFWAVRGGGANVGVVTAFEYRLHPIGLVLGGGGLYPLPKAKAALRLYRELTAECPDELSANAGLGMAPDGSPVLGIAVAYCGALDAGQKLLGPVRSLEGCLGDAIRPMSYLDLQRGGDAAFPRGQRHYWKASFLRRLDDAAIDVLLDFAARLPSPQTQIGLQQMHGAAARVAPADTAFAHRHDQYDFLILAQWRDARDDEKGIRWARDLHDAMRPFLEDAVYVNDLGDEGLERIRSAYGPNYDRLLTVKTAYDPRNFFRRNQNITPLAEPARRP